jgi:hypothetical protein
MKVRDQYDQPPQVSKRLKIFSDFPTYCRRAGQSWVVQGMKIENIFSAIHLLQFDMRSLKLSTENHHKL